MIISPQQLRTPPTDLNAIVIDLIVAAADLRLYSAQPIDNIGCQVPFVLEDMITFTVAAARAGWRDAQWSLVQGGSTPSVHTRRVGFQFVHAATVERALDNYLSAALSAEAVPFAGELKKGTALQLTVRFPGPPVIVPDRLQLSALIERARAAGWKYKRSTAQTLTLLSD